MCDASLSRAVKRSCRRLSSFSIDEGLGANHIRGRFICWEQVPITSGEGESTCRTLSSAGTAQNTYSASRPYALIT
eukprot:5032327-Pyramimonas_sp.AAC.1